MNSDTIQSLVRNILQVVMGILVTKGWVDNNNTELVVGGGSSIAVACWGIWHQWKHKQQLTAAQSQSTPTPPTP